MALAFQAGLLNIGGYLACHQFVSHVTGFASIYGLEFSIGNYDRALGMLVVPALFLLGAMLSGYLVDLRLKLRQRPRYYVVFGIMFISTLIVVVAGIEGFFGPFGQPLRERGYWLVALLCLICGMQNGTITVVSRAIVRTTHLTGITTDLGIGIVRVLNKGKLHDKIDDELKANFMRLGIILFFGLGSLVGAFLFPKLNFLGFLIPAVVTGVLFAGTLFSHFALTQHGKGA